jgi:hypothetical protein
LFNFNIYFFYFLFCSTPALEGEHWPNYSRENPIYFIFNAEGEEDLRSEKYGRGPMVTSCTFWNDYLPKLRQAIGKLNFKSIIQFHYLSQPGMLKMRTFFNNILLSSLDCLFEVFY